MITLIRVLLLSALTCLTLPALAQQESEGQAEFRWLASIPLVSPRNLPGMEAVSIKDPSVVRYGDAWHLFCTVRGTPRTHAVVYLTFKDWNEAHRAEHQLLTLHEGYYCAPQVFYFTPHKKWYMICQASSEAWKPNYQPAYSTNDDIADPAGWSPLQPLIGHKPQTVKNAWLDFWVICDQRKAHLFFTSLDGHMWRADTRLADFPGKWSLPKVALKGDIFEASHTYRVNDSGGKHYFLTMIEAQHGHGWRYFKAYRADALAGPWRAVADTKEHAFASLKNVTHPPAAWTDNVSHGEILRAGYDEQLAIDPAHMQIVFQGVLEVERQGKAYGAIPWRLGLLEATP